jgi:hypothetical protein
MSHHEEQTEGSERSPNLPSSFLFKLCMDLAASDPQELDTLTLTSRLHILAALGSVCRDLHDVVWEHAMPRMQSLHVSPEGLRERRGRPRPSYPRLALMTDKEVYRLAFEVCEFINFKHSMALPPIQSCEDVDRHERQFYVDRLLIASECWEFMPLILVAYNTDGRT